MPCADRSSCLAEIVSIDYRIQILRGREIGEPPETQARPLIVMTRMTRAGGGAGTLSWQCRESQHSFYFQLRSRSHLPNRLSAGAKQESKISVLGCYCR